MDYSRIYNELIKNAKCRKIEGYVERHHIIPKCIGGSNDSDNIVKLTAKEHFIAHLLLIKIYLNIPSIISAAVMMCVASKTHKRCTSRLYDRLRKKHSEAMKIMQGGSKNSQFGTCWISNLETEKCIRILNDELIDWLDLGWIKKRIIKFDNYKCEICNNSILEGTGKYCSDKCRKTRKRKSRLWGCIDELCEDYKVTQSVKATLLNFGFNSSGGNNTSLMKELRRRNIAA